LLFFLMSPKTTGKDHFEEEHAVLRLLWGLHVYLLHGHPMTIPVAAGPEDVNILGLGWFGLHYSCFSECTNIQP
jgi:hypothetical protein